MKMRKKKRKFLFRGNFAQLLLLMRKFVKLFIEHKEKIWVLFLRIGKFLQLLAWLGTFTVAIISVCQYKRIGEDYKRTNRPYVYVGEHKQLQIVATSRDLLKVSGRYIVCCNGEVPGYDVVIQHVVNSDPRGDLLLMPEKPQNFPPRWIAPDDGTEIQVPPMLIADSSYFHIYIWYSSPLNIKYRYHRVFLMAHSGKISQDIDSD